jgi:trimethylamine--corrinoid protein Co-methyltransferase
MSTGNTPMGAIETTMLNLGCAQVGKSLGLPTHGYMVATDARAVDVQAGMESGGSALLGALAAINMISGAGMIDFLACHSIEKLVIDAEAIANAQRLLAGIEPRGETLALGSFAQTGLTGEFLKLKETRTLFRHEQHFPSPVIDRGSEPVASNILDRAQNRAEELLATYRKPSLGEEKQERLYRLAIERAAAAGLNHLPAIAREELVAHEIS